MINKTVLYLGLKVPQEIPGITFIHYPVIKIIPRQPNHPEVINSFKQLHKYTHLLFTSQSGVDIFFDYLAFFYFHLLDIQKKTIIAVGQKTASRIAEKGIQPDLVASEETSEGIVKELEKVSLKRAYLFWPHSALSRPILTSFFQKQKILYHDCVFYETVSHMPGPLPDLNGIDEIIFTSPSTVDGFLAIFGKLPIEKQLTAIGPITRMRLESCFCVL